MDADTAERATQGAAELIVSVERLADQRAAHKQKPPLSEGAQMVSNATRKSLDMIFEHAMGRIAAVRKACDAMEASLISKKDGMLASLDTYVAALDTIDNETTKQQTAVGDAIVAQDSLG